MATELERQGLGVPGKALCDYKAVRKGGKHAPSKIKEEGDNYRWKGEKGGKGSSNQG